MNPELLPLLQTLREVKLQVESLKTMMFEHRLAFVETYHQIEARLAQSDAIKALDAQIAAAEKSLGR